MLVVTVDTNRAESPLAGRLAELLPKATIKTEPLAVADVLLEAHGKSIFIERKTLLDMAASIADGRAEEQAERLADLKEQGATACILVQTDRLPQHDSKIRNMPASCFYGMLNRFQFAQGLVVLFCGARMEDVSARIAQLATKLGSTAFAPPKPVDSMRPGKRQRSGSGDCRSAVLMGVPKVSLATAEALLERWQSLRSVGEASVEDLANTPVGQKRLGPALAQRIKDTFA